jgi:ribonuclease BN (tRNA processing enzyme)
LQFDASRGTAMRLSQLGVGPEQLNAVFFTHMHNDHSEGFADLVQLRWSFNGTGPKIDAVCGADAVSPLGVSSPHISPMHLFIQARLLSGIQSSGNAQQAAQPN